MRARAAAVGFVFALAAVAAADDGPLARVELDKRVARVAHDSATRGSEVFNKGNHEGCYRLYQGTLLALHPLLDHRPKLAEFVKNRLDVAAGLAADPVKGAGVLREGLDAVLAETVAALAPPKKVLWDRLGGEKVVRTAVKDFLAAAAADPKVNFSRGGKYKLDEKAGAKLEQTLVEMVSAGTGGPLKYSGKDMVAAHAGMKITQPEFAAAVVHFAQALERAKIPADARLELVELVGGTRDFIVDR